MTQNPVGSAGALPSDSSQGNVAFFSVHMYSDPDSPALSSYGPGPSWCVQSTGRHIPCSHPAKGSAPGEPHVLGFSPTHLLLPTSVHEGAGDLVPVPGRPSQPR